MAKKVRTGRPTTYNSKFHNEDFLRLSRKGKAIIQIAGEWEVSRDTIYEWVKKHREFSDTVKQGKAISERWYADLGQQAMLGQATVDGKSVIVRLGFYTWMTKNLFKWSDKVEEVPADEKKKRPLKKVSDEDLDEM